MGQVEELFKAVEDMQQHDILKLIDRVRELKSMANQVAIIENFLGLNKKTSNANAKGNLRDVVRDLRAKLVDMKAQI